MYDYQDIDLFSRLCVEGPGAILSSFREWEGCCGEVVCVIEARESGDRGFETDLFVLNHPMRCLGYWAAQSY